MGESAAAATRCYRSPDCQSTHRLFGPNLVDFGSGTVFVVKPQYVNLRVRFPFIRHVFFRKDGLDRALRLTGTAIDAFVRFDVQHPVFAFLKMDAIHGADVYACLVHDVHTRFSYHVGHSSTPPSLPGLGNLQGRWLCSVLSSPAIGPHKDTLPTSGLASARTPLGVRKMLIQLMSSAGLCWPEG